MRDGQCTCLVSSRVLLSRDFSSRLIIFEGPIMLIYTNGAVDRGCKLEDPPRSNVLNICYLVELFISYAELSKINNIK